MKLLVVSLALTIFAGSQAFVLRDESDSKVSQLKQELREYKEKTTDALITKFILVEHSDVGRALSSWLGKTYENVEQHLEALQASLPAEAIEVKRQVSSALRDLERKVANGLRSIHNEAAPEREAFRQALEHDLLSNLEKLDHYIRPLRHGFVKTCSELNAKLDEMLKQQMEKLQPKVEKIQSWVRKVQDYLESVTDQVQEHIRIEVEKAHNVLQRPAARVLEVFKKHREAFNQWVRTPLLPEDH